MEPFKPKPLLNKSELRQIKKSRTRVEGKKVITDDVKKLKSLNVTPDLPKKNSLIIIKNQSGLNIIYLENLDLLTK